MEWFFSPDNTTDMEEDALILDPTPSTVTSSSQLPTISDNLDIDLPSKSGE